MASLYDMNHARRGRAVIINNVNFQPLARLNRRQGSRQDADSLGTCLGNLRFDVQKHEDQSTDEMKSILQKVSEEDHRDVDCIVISIMSHGGMEGICGTDFRRRDFTGLLTLSDVVDPFKGDNCPSLVGKPKIFILNACRGDDIDYGVAPMDEVDAANIPAPVSKIPIDADIFICFSCSEGYSTLRDEFSGSYFIQDFTRVFTEYGRTLHLSELVLKVKEMVAARQTVVRGSSQREMQMPVVLDTLRKLIYFDRKAQLGRQPSAEISRLVGLFE